MAEQLELPLVQSNSTSDRGQEDSSQENKAVEKKLSDRDFKIAMAKAYKERNDQIRQNKAMLEDMELEVRYWKAKRDLVVYRFDMMDYYIKNLNLEPTYLAKIEEQKLKEERAAGLPDPTSTSILS